MKKINSIEMSQNEIISSIQQLKLEDGDVLIFDVKTNENAVPLVPLDVVSETAKMIGEVLEGRSVSGLFLMDKICLFSIEDSKKAIERLENCISYIREATGKVRDIENGNSEELFTIIDCEQRGDQNPRAL